MVKWTICWIKFDVRKKLVYLKWAKSPKLRCRLSVCGVCKHELAQMCPFAFGIVFRPSFELLHHISDIKFDSANRSFRHQLNCGLVIKKKWNGQKHYKYFQKNCPCIFQGFRTPVGEKLHPSQTSPINHYGLQDIL